MVISITASGYIKRLPLTTYRTQGRGGIGITGMDLKEGDYIKHLFVASTHDYLLFFTTVGKVYRVKVHELPLGSRQSKGRALVNVLPLRQDEYVQAVIDTRDYSEGKYLLFATRNGVVKKTEFKAYDTVLRADGIIALKIRGGDELIGVRLTDGEDDVLMVSRNGYAVRFSERDVRAMGRDTSGVAGMRLRSGDEVIAVEIARDDQDLLVVTENGFGKRTRVEEYPTKGRGTMGVLTVRYTEARGRLAGAMIVRDGYEVMLISQDGTVIRQAAEGISRMGRATQGVRVMNMREEDRVSSIARVSEQTVTDAADSEAGDEPPVDGAIEGEPPTDAIEGEPPTDAIEGESPSQDGAVPPETDE
jgi:DNA gyrase subunit A